MLVDEEELEEIQDSARRRRLTVAEWVRQALREARRREPRRASRAKLEAIRSAARYGFPAPDVDQMLSEIERGYGERADGTR